MPRAACECCEWLGSVLLFSPSGQFEKDSPSLFQSLGSLRNRKPRCVAVVTVIIIFYYYSLLSKLGIEPRASCMLGNSLQLD